MLFRKERERAEAKVTKYDIPALFEDAARDLQGAIGEVRIPNLMVYDLNHPSGKEQAARILKSRAFPDYPIGRFLRPYRQAGAIEVKTDIDQEAERSRINGPTCVIVMNYKSKWLPRNPNLVYRFLTGRLIAESQSEVRYDIPAAVSSKFPGKLHAIDGFDVLAIPQIRPESDFFRRNEYLNHYISTYISLHASWGLGPDSPHDPSLNALRKWRIPQYSVPINAALQLSHLFGELGISSQEIIDLHKESDLDGFINLLDSRHVGLFDKLFWATSSLPGERNTHAARIEKLRHL